MSLSSFAFTGSSLSSFACPGNVVRIRTFRRIHICTKCGDKGHVAGICSVRKVFAEAEEKTGKCGKSQSVAGGEAPMLGGSGKAVVVNEGEVLRAGSAAVGLVPLQGGACEGDGGCPFRSVSDAGSRLVYGDKLALRAWHTAAWKQWRVLGVLQLTKSVCFLC
jgi:hypothetical protein